PAPPRRSQPPPPAAISIRMKHRKDRAMSQNPHAGPATPAPQGKTYHANPKEMRRILFSSFLGTAVEYYDFILYATAAGIVFNQVFFAGLDPNTALFVSFGTLAVGYIARPLGA